jgi:hypothetical protein
LGEQRRLDAGERPDFYDDALDGICPAISSDFSDLR